MQWRHWTHIFASKQGHAKRVGQFRGDGRVLRGRGGRVLHDVLRV